jgi:hypothetical protein
MADFESLISYAVLLGWSSLFLLFGLMWVNVIFRIFTCRGRDDSSATIS